MVFFSTPFPRLLDELAKIPKIGAIAPLLQGPDGKPQIEDYYPSLPSTMQFIFLRSIFKRAPFAMAIALRWFHSKISPSGVHQVDQIPGAFLLFRKELFPDGMFLNEAYFIWMEDVDFCFRLKRDGLKAVVVADERVTHLGGTSFKMQSIPWKRLMFNQSYITYLGLHFKLLPYSVHMAVLALNALLTLVFYPWTHAWKGPKAVISRLALEAKVLFAIVRQGWAMFWKKVRSA